MPEHRLIAAMEEEVAARIAQVRREADEAIRRIEAEADQELAEAQRAESARVERQIVQFRRDKRSRFDNQRRARVRDMQFAIAEQVFGDVAQAVAAVRQRSDYPVIWSRLLSEALAAYHTERNDIPNVRVAEADRDLARRSGEAQAVEAVAAVPDGVELVSPDGRLRVKNDLASRLRKGREEFLKMIGDEFNERLAK